MYNTRKITCVVYDNMCMYMYIVCRFLIHLRSLELRIHHRICLLYGSHHLLTTSHRLVVHAQLKIYVNLYDESTEATLMVAVVNQGYFVFNIFVMEEELFWNAFLVLQ